ncbi:MAG: hypothetical protein LBJ57_03320 [Prevotellaceae bacterium]|jgi:hypothetical protein|nr:hypothetical protein [Prevotellaceae bacterium]
MRVPEKYYDEVFCFKGQWDMPSKCGLKIVCKPCKKYIVVTELYQDNPGASVTYAGVSLACQICEAKGLKLSEVAYVECNPDASSKLSFYDEEFFEVTFGDTPQATYRQLSKDEVKEMLEEGSGEGIKN